MNAKFLVHKMKEVGNFYRIMKGKITGKANEKKVNFQEKQEAKINKKHEEDSNRDITAL